MSTFQSLPPGLFEFFNDLTVDNSTAFWQANKDRWEHDARGPMRDLLGVLSRIRQPSLPRRRPPHGSLRVAAAELAGRC